MSKWRGEIAQDAFVAALVHWRKVSGYDNPVRGSGGSRSATPFVPRNGLRPAELRLAGRENRQRHRDRRPGGRRVAACCATRRSRLVLPARSPRVRSCADARLFAGHGEDPSVEGASDVGDSAWRGAGLMGLDDRMRNAMRSERHDVGTPPAAEELRQRARRRVRRRTQLGAAVMAVVIGSSVLAITRDAKHTKREPAAVRASRRAGRPNDREVRHRAQHRQARRFDRERDCRRKRRPARRLRDRVGARSVATVQDFRRSRSVQASAGIAATPARRRDDRQAIRWRAAARSRSQPTTDRCGCCVTSRSATSTSRPT